MVPLGRSAGFALTRMVPTMAALPRRGKVWSCGGGGQCGTCIVDVSKYCVKTNMADLL